MTHPADTSSRCPRRTAALCLFVLLAGSVPAGAAGRKSAKAPAQYPWDAPPTLEQIYRGYEPAFSRRCKELLRGRRTSRLKAALKFSRQKYYINVADVTMDAQVWPILKKANQLVAAQKYRKASELYRRILKQYPDDLVKIAEEGIFIPAHLYAQRKILAYPPKELDYYRVLHDPAARDLYERSLKRYSIFDCKELVKFHLATSYGDDALFALGNDAMDKAKYNEARHYYERILTYHGLKENDRDKVALDRDQVWARLAICYRHLGRNAAFKVAVNHIKNKREPTVANLLRQLETFRYDPFAAHQREGRRSARHDAMDDKILSEPMPYPFSANRGQWRVPLTPRPRYAEPDVRPWATESDLFYKDMNVLYSRSLLTGELNWVFAPGGASWDWDRYAGLHHTTAFYPSQGILVHEGAVAAHMFVYGPSLVVVDQYTGKLLWAKGPMAARSEAEWLDRYQAAPAAGRGMIVAPVVHDDIRGLTHVASTAGLIACETRSGKVLWRKTLARISPLKLTQSRYARKIRILSTTPIVKDGVVYHATNAGIVAAVDAQTGDVLWLTRYPQIKSVLDNLTAISGSWRNESPLVRGNRLFVTPVDSPVLLCLDKQTGKILWTYPRGNNWYMVGFTSDGFLCLAGRNLTFLRPENGSVAYGVPVSGDGWLYAPPSHRNVLGGIRRGRKPPKGMEAGINGEGDDFWFPFGHIHCLPTLTRDGKLLFSMQEWFGEPGPHQGPFNTEFVFDLKTRGIVLQRRWYSPVSFISRFGYYNNLTVPKRPVNEEPESFDPAMRMTFRRWGVPFEVDVTRNHIVMRYDSQKLNRVLARQKDFGTVFARAEMARRRRDLQKAIELYEKAKALLPSEEEDRRKNINLRLYPLYKELARWGHQEADYDFVEAVCKKMGATASKPSQEIRALLAYAELHERKNRWSEAVRVLQNAIRHYWREPIPVSAFELGDRRKLLATMYTGLQTLLNEVPEPYREDGRQIMNLEKAALQDYFLSVANVDTPYTLETATFIAKRLRALLRRAPEQYRIRYEAQAREALKQCKNIGVGERLLWCWPESQAAKNKVKELAAQTAQMKPTERQATLWRLADLADVCGLGPKAVPDGQKGLGQIPPPDSLPQGQGMKQVQLKNKDPDQVRLALPQQGDVAQTAHLLFVGGRKKRAYGNRFTVMCWDMKKNQRVWISREILLRGQLVKEEGSEIGFEKILIHKHLAIVHGRHDVIALDWRPGRDLDRNGKKEKKWHFRVPLGFEIQATGLHGGVLVLSGRGSTVAISPETGDILWDASETGKHYAGPFFYKDAVVTVRNSPAGIVFRKTATGRLLRRLRVPGLTKNRKHPVYAQEGTTNPAASASAEAAPVAFGDGYIALTNGRTYFLVDLDKQRIRWSREAANLPPVTDPSYRMWIAAGKLLVLKPYYSVLANAVFDLSSGDLLWHRREGGAKQEAKLKKYLRRNRSRGSAAVGLVLSSMTPLGNHVYGIQYQMGASSVTLVGMDPTTGNKIMSVTQHGYEDPEAWVEPSWSKDCVVVRIQDGPRVELWQVNVKTGKIVQKLKLDGSGRLGNYGQTSAVWQGPYLAIWGFETTKLTTPAK